MIVFGLFHGFAIVLTIHEGFIVSASATDGKYWLNWAASLAAPYEPTYEERLALGRKQ